MSESEAREPKPTWEELARARRVNERLKSEVKVREEEIEALEQQIELDEGRRERRRAKAIESRERIEELEALVAQSEVADGIRTGHIDELRSDIERLNLENGQLEARLARALGRTFVVSRDDEMAAVVSSLLSIREWCQATVDQEDRENCGQVIKYSPPGYARVRQVLAEVKRVLEFTGVKEEQREKQR
jgi:hypothetical protein